MITTVITVIVLLAYLSLLIELIFFPVPSVASSFNLWKGNEAYATDGFQMGQQAQQWTILKKLFVLGLPILIIVATFTIPLLALTNWSPAIFKITGDRPLVIFIIGILLVILGRLICFRSVFAIRQDNTQQGDLFKLHKDSWYRLSRNPIQLGMYIFLTGLLLLFPSWIFFLGSIIYVLYMDYKIAIEEKFLLAKFGQAYRDYKNKTRRYI